MKIRLIWVGKTRERFVEEGIRKYAALLGHFAEIEFLVVKEEKGKDQDRIRQKEGERILGLKIPYILMDEKGKSMTSTEFASFVERQGPALTFVTGGAYGVSEAVRAAAARTVALSPMTLTHEMARLFLVEQTYRALTIIHRRGYHH